MLQPQKKIFGEKIYPWILVLLPVLSLYRFGPVDLDVIVMALFFVLACWRKRFVQLTPVNRITTTIFCYILLVTAINIAFGQKFSPSGDIILRAGRYCLYLLIVFFLGNDSITYQKLMRAYRMVAFAAT